MAIGLTRFKQRTPDGEIDGPVSGALQVLSIGPLSVAAGSTVNLKVDLPAGCRFRVTDASFRAGLLTADTGVSPTVKVGLDVIGSTRLVNTTVATTNLGALTVKATSQNVPAGSVILVQYVANSTASFKHGILTLVGHVSAPPTSVIVRNASHY